MFGLFELTGMIEALFVSIPESVGLLAFGVGLMSIAAAGRWVLSQLEAKNDDEATRRA
ncbi:MAG TPA: hypothetical protein VGI80_06485 [Pyrinomonadaceae bacterium]